jgi:hypothetical protein
MDRDTFWENVVDFLKLTAKIIIVMVGLQLLLLVTGSDMKIPYIYSNMMKFLLWVKATFSGVRFAM